MALKGDLASVDLAQVFQMLALNKKVGLLSIQSPRLWKILYFDHRGVTLYYNEHLVLDRSISVLVRSGRLFPEAVTEARTHAAQQNISLIESFLAGGYLTEEDLDSATRVQIEEEVYDLFFCKDARFEFFEGASSMEGREGVINPRHCFNTDTVIMEAARRIDEWSYLSERITSSQEVYRSVGAADPSQFDAESLAVLDLVDGQRCVARIVEISALGTFVVYKHLSGLLDAGVVEALPDIELLEAATRCMTEGRLQDSINLYERAINLGVGVPDVYSQAADAFQAAELYEKATLQLKCDAEFRLAAGDRRGAAQRLNQAVKILPLDLEARERLVDLTLGGGERIEGLDPLQEGKTLVDLRLESGDLKRARNLLEKLLRLAPEDLDLKKALVNVHTRTGDTKRVIELYESMAQDLVRLRRPIEAVGFLQKILLLDRSRTDISERMRALYQIDERSRSRRRALAALAVAFLAMVGLGIGYWYYDRHAEEAFDQIDVKKLVEAREFAQAAVVYEAFIRNYPLTLSVRRAQEELARVESARKKHDARLANERAGRERELARLRTEYRSEWQRHRDLFLSGDPDASFAALERARGLVTQAGEPPDLAWALEEQVEKTYVTLRDFLASAERLSKESRRLMEAGDWERARKAALELVSKYEITKAARQSRIPMQVTSRPQGARIFMAGQSLGVTTPSVVMCPTGKQSFRLEMDGFQPEVLQVDARREARVESIMKVIAKHRITFPAQVQTGVGTNGYWLIAGLRGGRVGVARAEDGKVLHTTTLGGLKAVDSIPVVAGNRAFFLSNEGTVEGILVEQGQLAPGWPVKIDRGPATELVVGDGRLVFTDRENRLCCYDQTDGRQLWTIPLGGAASGRPVIQRRSVACATTDGRVVVVDAANGKVVSTWRSPSGITTRLHTVDGIIYFAGSDGFVRAVNEAEGKILWSTHIGRTVVNHEFEMVGGGIVLLGAQNRLLRLSLEDGAEQASQNLGAATFKSLLAAGDRVFLTVNVPRERSAAGSDLLQARDADDLTVHWEYGETGIFVASPVTSGKGIALADVNGEVVLFR